MTFPSITAAAFIPDPAVGPYLGLYHALSFPSTWRDPILSLYQHGKSYPVKQVPIRRLNTLLKAVAPDLVAVATNAPLDDGKPWLYTDAPYPVALLDTFIHAWLRDMQPDPTANRLVLDTVRSLRTRALTWDLMSVDLLQQQLSQDGTALPAPHLYQLLPQVLAGRIAALPPYEYCGQQVAFAQVVDTNDGAELMSWPPHAHQTKTTDGSTRTWYYSGTIKVSLRTEPFSPIPRIHLSVGIRRWVTGPVWMPRGRGVTAYLRSENSLVPGGPSSTRFAAATLEWDKKTKSIQWRQGGPEGMLTRVSATQQLPTPDILTKAPEPWLFGQESLIAAVTHQAAMGRHEIAPGIMPGERRRLIRWASQALMPHFVPMPDLQRSGIKHTSPRTVLEPHRPVRKVPKDADDDKRAEIANHNAAVTEHNTDVDLRNGITRRTLVGSAIGPAGLDVNLLYQTDLAKDTLIAAVEQSLSLSGHRREAGPRTWSWHTTELDLRVHTQPLGALGAPLASPEAGTQAPRRGAEHDVAISERRAETRTVLSKLGSDTNSHAPLVIIELEGKDAFKMRTTDPKFALRLGCADSAAVSQFLQPATVCEPEAEQDSKVDLAFRARAAWEDGLRQLGIRFVPPHSLGETIPQKLNQIAFWLVKRGSDSTNTHPQFTPIAVLLRPGHAAPLGRSAETTQWVPYPELLKSLVGNVRGEDLKTRDQQTAATAVFVQQTLYTLRNEPTLVVTHAQNTRSRWPWLRNDGLTRDRIQIGGGPAQRLALHGRHLRVARVADSIRDESPQWWAPREDLDKAGISKGLWIPPAACESDRVFYSTVDKPGTHVKVKVDDSKLTPHLTAEGKPRMNRTTPAWVPELLQFAMLGLQPVDDAETWAMFLHQQRFVEDYRSALGLPLVLHLAELASEYALPQEEIEPAPKPVKKDSFEGLDLSTDGFE